MPRASIIIPHLDGIVHLPDCLNALEAQTEQNFEVILVDNGSSDGSQAYVREQFPAVHLLELGRNFGFTGACNAGYAASTGEFVILLNNDTAVAAAWLAEILHVFDAGPDVGIVASKMMLFDRRDHFHNAGDYVRIDGIPGNRGVWQKDEGQFDTPEPVFSACGGAAAYRRTMLAELGFLDDDFFFSCEDVDMSWRAQLAGWEVWYQPTAVVYHKLKATGGSVTGSFYDGRNFLYLLWKNYPASLMRRHAGLILKAQLGITRDALRAWRGAAARARLRGQLAGLWGLPKMWRKRRRLTQFRRIDDETLAAKLTPVDDTPGRR